MTIGLGRNEDRLVNRELCLSAQLPLHHDVSVQSPHYCRRRTDPPVDLPLHPPLTREQDPEVLELLHLGQDLIPDPESALHPSPDNGLGFGATAADALRLACRYLPAASGVPQAKKFDASLIAGVHQRVRELPPRQAPTTLRPQLRSAALTMEVRNMAHSDSMSPASPVSKTCGRKSDDMPTKAIIVLRPRVSWCQVHIWTPLCLNMVFVIDNLWQAQKSDN
ncbi:hypothetical protein N1851_014720 [Merluccius polli]|uniref:Uncharacterized protein n=1 Tax=Merluccius polli TaxID=89951 RepID=A0AA47MTS4_MERPO|nr:hypothetical protein N1851_014720 [Merluccius polli]